MPSNSHYLLFSEASRHERAAQTWRFVLQNVESKRRFTATDNEPNACGERLELLAVVRGLEALDGPARVTLVTKSRYVSRGIKSGLVEWRANDWCWERFGRIVPVRDHDLWQRVDRALRFHQVECQTWRFDEAASEQHDAAAAAPRRSRRVGGRCQEQQRLSASGRAGSLPVERPIGGIGEKLVAFVKEVVGRPESLRDLRRPMRQSFGATA